MEDIHQFSSRILGSSYSEVELEIINSLCKLVWFRDPYTSGHEKRVANLAIAIAKKIEWPTDQIAGLYLAGLVHDIGKVIIPTEILVKQTKLTEKEFALIQKHPEVGYQILKNLPFTQPIAVMVQQHHERLDGSGYPFQLKGNEILKGARILAIADTIEAMAIDRPYRKGLGIELALDEIRKGSGSRFDSAYADVACELIDSQGLECLINQ